MLRLLGERGVEYLFGNGGTDFASVIDGYAALAGTGVTVPTPVTVPHENVAVAMAHGYYLQTGRPQVVMVHVTVGTANALNGLINANRSRAPLVLFAGRTPITDQGSPASRNAAIHWAQESFDQAAMVREYVKWDYELRSPETLAAVLDRAFAMALSEPRGPVYLTLPRELLAAPSPGTDEPVRLTAPASTPAPDPRVVAEVAAALRTARAPLILADAAGTDPRAVGELVALAEQLGAPVVEPGRHTVNFPTAHPLHQGYQPGELLAQSDCVLVVECDVPWLPRAVAPAPGATVAHVGVDPLQSRLPLWQFPVDHALTATPVAALAALRAAVTEQGGLAAELVTERTRTAAVAHDKHRSEHRAFLDERRGRTPIDFAWITHCLSEVADENCVFVNEYPLDLRFLELDTPGTFHGYPPSGGLGWGLGAALGVALAAPEKTVIACVGDGSYMFGNPTPAHWVSRRYDVPILVVIFNNAKWEAVEHATRGVHPGTAREGLPFTALTPAPDYELIARASGGHGERVDDPADLPAALSRALHVVRVERRSALLNVIGSR
jgi:acetolactate synthase-1/2/3 large subunit